MMQRTADLCDEEMTRWIDWFVRLFESLLMTFMGLLIGVIVVLMYVLIFELAGQHPVRSWTAICQPGSRSGGTSPSFSIR